MVTDCDADSCALISGTSFAAPHVAGALPLLMQAFPEMSGSEALDLLLRSVRAAARRATPSTAVAGWTSTGPTRWPRRAHRRFHPNVALAPRPVPRGSCKLGRVRISGRRGGQRHARSSGRR
ncbi:MAG: S8 family serine peptidase [Caulobacteraceae bacterium]